MNTILCAGGSATRVLEAVLHLCAAGLGPDRLRVLRIDPDHSNGNATRVDGLLDSYQALHRAFAGKLGPHKLFHTELEVLGSWSPVQPGDTLARLLHYDLLPGPAQDVARLLFTHAERNLVLDQGFRGHTAIGAAAMSLVGAATERDARGAVIDRPPWSDLVQRVRADLDGAGSRVFLLASVFGGTGASAIHPISRFLRGIPERNAAQLKIGVAALVPYFRFKSGGPDAAELAARAEDFALATKAAALFYQKLRAAGDWDFDAMYWIGDSSPARDLPYAAGGPDQRNPAHFVDLIAALAATEFFIDPAAGKACYYSGPRRDIEPDSEDNILDWADLPLRRLERHALKQKLWRCLLIGLAHVGFFQELLGSDELRRRPAMVPWYHRYFRGARDPEERLDRPAAREVLDRLGEFFDAYHLPFWGQVLDSRGARLFNKEVLPPLDPTGVSGRDRRKVDLARLRNLFFPDRGVYQDPDGMDALFQDMIRVGQPTGARGAPAYLSLLCAAADRFIAREESA